MPYKALFEHLSRWANEDGNQTDKPQYGVYIGNKSNPATWLIHASIWHNLKFLSVSCVCVPQHWKLPLCSGENCTIQQRSSLWSWQCSYWQGLPCQRKVCRIRFISASTAETVCAYLFTGPHSIGQILLDMFLNTVQQASVAWSYSCIMTKLSYIHLQELPICHSISQSTLPAASIFGALTILMKSCRHCRNINHVLRESSGTKNLRWQMCERQGPWTWFLISN